jgi:hypothetical protein
MAGLRAQATAHGSTKTRPLIIFGGPSTPGEVEKIDPGAIWQVDVSLNAQFIESSRDLGRVRLLRSLDLNSHSQSEATARLGVLEQPVMAGLARSVSGDRRRP